MSRVTFNVGGKRFETRRSTIEQIHDQDDLLNMLLRHNNGEDAIFIDREPTFFNDILRIYRNGGFYADPIKGKDTQEWLDALDYYGLGYLCYTPQSSISMREHIEQNLRKERTEHFESKKRKHETWKDHAAIFLECIAQHTVLEFVKVSRHPDLDQSGRQIEHHNFTFTMDWVDENRNSLQTYARELGYCLEFRHGDIKADSFNFPPASSLKGLTKRSKEMLRVEIQYLV